MDQFNLGKKTLAAVLMVGLWVSGCTQVDTTSAHPVTKSGDASTRTPAPVVSPEPPSPSPVAPADEPSVAAQKAKAGSAQTLSLLATLPIKGRAPKTGYSRAQFGQAWSDDVDTEGGHNGCDTRNDILQRDLKPFDFRSGSDCVIESGTLNDPYTGKTIDFLRGQETSSAVQIDHMVALSNAWQTGAQQLSLEQRTDLANDPLNLQAVDGPTNQAKGDGDAATWLPPNRSYRCAYVTRQVEVKAKYNLWVTQAEHDAISRLLHNCDAAAATPTPKPRPTPTRAAAPPPQPKPSYHPPVNSGGGSAYYKNCSAARAAGVAPIYAGQPGYRAGLDRDHDGVACE